MSNALVECVPNISEGRDDDKIERIVTAARAVAGCHVLGVEPDRDYHRTVITLAGEPQPVQQGAVALILAAIDEIDMRTHQGEHPRLGAVDVCPFVPLQGITMEACADLARRTVQDVAAAAAVPLFLYGAAASHPERTLLSNLRKGEYEELASRLDGSNRRHEATTMLPDEGASVWSESVARSGGITVGARSILVAYNVNVDEPDAVVAKKVGSLVRSSGRLLKSPTGQRMRTQGLLPSVQGMGVTLEELGISQVSMNLLDVDACPLHLAYETVKSVVGDHGTVTPGSEIVGLVPLNAMLEAGRFYLPEASDEHELVNAAINGLGLREHHRFEPDESIIEWAIRGLSA